MRARAVVAVVLTVLVVMAASPTASAGPDAPPSATASKQCALPGPGADFGTAAPAEEALDAAKVQQAVTTLSARLRLSVHVFRNNCLVATDPINPVTDAVHNNMWSVTKSVVSMLTGIAVGDGRLNLDDPIDRYLPTGPGWGDAAHRAITVRQLLTQSSGLDQAILAEAGTMAIDPSLAREALAQPFRHVPGTTFQYSQLGPALLAYVVQRAVGQDLVDYAQQRLFGPVGIEPGSYFWLRDREGTPYGFAHLFLTPPQLGRLALLMSNDGRWQGQQLVPESYVHAVSAPTPTNGCYGLLFWTNRAAPCTGADIPHAQTLQRRAIPSAPPDTYEMNGTGGQLAITVPSLNITVVTTGYFGNVYPNPPNLVGAGPDAMQHTFMRTLMQAVQDADVPDPGPYRGDPIDLNVNPFNFADPRVAIRDLTAPGCNVVFCDGTVPTRGLIENVRQLPGLL